MVGTLRHRLSQGRRFAKGSHKLKHAAGKYIFGPTGGYLSLSFLGAKQITGHLPFEVCRGSSQQIVRCPAPRQAWRYDDASESGPVTCMGWPAERRWFDRTKHRHAYTCLHIQGWTVGCRRMIPYPVACT